MHPITAALNPNLNPKSKTARVIRKVAIEIKQQPNAKRIEKSLLFKKNTSLIKKEVTTVTSLLYLKLERSHFHDLKTVHGALYYTNEINNNDKTIKL